MGEVWPGPCAAVYRGSGAAAKQKNGRTSRRDIVEWNLEGSLAMVVAVVDLDGIADMSV